jgi:hypothetical protein
MRFGWAVAAIAATMWMAFPAQAQPQGAQPAPAAPQRAQPQGPQVPTRVIAQTLVALCQQERSACLTYILGSADAFASALAAAGRPQLFCVPPGTSNDQIAQTVVNYLRAHPEEAQTNAALVVLAGLGASYRCGY